MSHLLSWMIFTPLLGAFLILFIPKTKEFAIKVTAVIATAIPLLLCLPLLKAYDTKMAGMQFMEKLSWIPMFNIEYFLGIDGISVTLVLLTALLSFLCIFVSWNVKKMVKGYFVMFLLLHVGMMGVFCALDFFLFYVFWELMLLPMYFLIGIWGGERKEYAAIKFFLYTLLGSVLMLVAMLGLYYYSGIANEGLKTFNILTLSGIPWEQYTIDIFGMTLPFDKAMWWMLFIGFAIKVPVFPFHTWLPWAHVQAPTGVSVILAGVLLKMGTYGLLRFNFTMLPKASQAFSYFLVIIGIVNVIYGALCAMAQKDLKKLVAYSSISHMGYCLLGMSVFTMAGMMGAVLQMFNHGLSAAMMFMLVGVLYDRLHHRHIVTPQGEPGFGGIALKAPWITGFWTLAVFASLGLPTLNGFISEALVFLGAFPVYRTETIICASGIVLTAAYLLWMLQRVFLGPWTTKEKNSDGELVAVNVLKDLTARELFTLVPISLLIIWIGVYPSPLLNLFKRGVEKIMGANF